MRGRLKGGGFNGRPEKLEDVCYSWWVGASLAMIRRLHWVDGGEIGGVYFELSGEFWVGVGGGIR